MAIQMRRGNLADFDPTKMMPGEFAVTLDADNNLNKRVLITFAAGTVKQLMTVEDATAQMIEATDAATAEAEAWAHGNSFTATEMFTSAGSATVTLAYSPSSINAVKINDVATTAYTRNDKVITFNTAPAVGSKITVVYAVSTSTDNAKYYKEQAADFAAFANAKATQANTSATNAANSATTASTKATQAANSATLSESYAVGGTGTRPGEDTDNAKYYKDQMANYLSGIYHFIGSVNSYADLPTMGMVRGDTYDILTADPTHEIAAGDNVAWTGTKWDKLSGIIAIMIGATASSNGAKGLVPAPMIADREKYLRGDGTWANPNTAVDDVYSVMGQNGAKNLIPYPYYEKTHTENGITFTDNGDGTITANGTATDTAVFGVVLGNTALSANGNLTINTNKPLILSGCPSGGGNNTYRIQYGLTDGTSYWAKTASDTGSGVTLTPIDGLNSYCFDVIRVMVFNGYTANNLTFKPMLRLASDTDNTYQPYAKTNRQLTEQMAVPKYDAANRREYFEGGAAFDGNIDSAPTAGSNNAVSSGGTKTYVDNAVATKHNTDTVEFVGNVTMAANYLGTITASSLGISDCTKYNWDIRSKSWEAFPQIANVTTSSVTFYVRWLSSTSGGSVSLKNSGEVQITLTGMTRHNI